MAVLPFIIIACIIAVALILIPKIPIFKKFESVTYTNSKKVAYRLDFYRDHTTAKLQSGNTQLVSKVSEDGKLPIALSIATGDASTYKELEDCGEYKKIATVQNQNLKQLITVCDMQSGKVISNKDYSNTVYIAVFLYNNQTNVVTIAQDYSRVNTSKPAAAQAATAKFGLQPYQKDLERILASIKVQ